MKTIKAINNYYDLQLKKDIKAGDVYEVDDKRALELSTRDNAAKTVLAEIIEEATPTTDKVAKRSAKKKKTEVK